MAIGVAVVSLGATGSASAASGVGSQGVTGFAIAASGVGRAISLTGQALAEPVAPDGTTATSSKTNATATDVVLTDGSINWLALYYWQEHGED